jgi:hypothetical protein
MNRRPIRAEPSSGFGPAERSGYRRIASGSVGRAGLWTIGVNFAIAVAAAGPDKDHVRPPALVRVDHLVLAKASDAGPLTFDAAEVAKAMMG